MAFDIAVGVEAVGALPGADVLLSQLVVLVVLASQLDAVTPGQAFKRPEWQVADVAGDGGGGLVADGKANPGDLAGGVAWISHYKTWVADTAEAVGAIVAVGEVFVTVDVAHFH